MNNPSLDQNVAKALKDSANIMHVTPFYFKVFSGKIKGITLAIYLIEITINSSFTRLQVQS